MSSGDSTLRGVLNREAIVADDGAAIGRPVCRTAHTALAAGLAALSAAGVVGCGSSGSAGAGARSTKVTTPKTAPAGSITDQQARATAFHLGAARAHVLGALGPPAAVGDPTRPGRGDTCVYYHTAGRVTTDQWRFCFRAGNLSSVSTYATG